MPIKFGIIYICVQILFAFVVFFSFTIKFHKKTSRIRIIPVFQYNLFIDFFWCLIFRILWQNKMASVGRSGQRLTFYYGSLRRGCH